MIDIYGTKDCPACKTAVKLCELNNVEFAYYDLMEEPNLMDALVTRIGGFRTVPQIFNDEDHIGGYEDLVDYFTEDKLKIA